MVLGDQIAFGLVAFLEDICCFLVHEVVEGIELITVGLGQLILLPLVTPLHFKQCPCLQVLLELLDIEPAQLGLSILAVLLVDEHELLL